ncbi:hypothetical protein [Tropicibacter naphthalenivorans]|uniref:DUF1127 domain-containing protein n=1 Tax=Tropicibacter naphthalenivorans TaxID=441103 RepID=A0A0P1GMV0_9RHOB|nr:hypothetical protein [Tropicibacter naphthalenivorans]CUH77106.1 hypothetical protein TRN7648_01298 [Tropicibacter naphthalenivorans]SMC60670.1 hypothetical protein SAMN04488093_102320 [Tropicibacter naphthalenivorans]
MFASLRTRLEKRALYRRTLAELRSLPHGTAADLNIAPEDLDRIAYQAVYGQ